MSTQSPDSKSIAASACPAGLLAARRGGSAPDRYVVPSEADRVSFSTLVASLLGPAIDRTSAGDRAWSLGYRLEEVPEIPGTLLLREIPTQRRGGGAEVLHGVITACMTGCCCC